MTPNTIPWGDEPEGGCGMTWYELATLLMNEGRKAEGATISEVRAQVKDDICRTPVETAQKAVALWREEMAGQRMKVPVNNETLHEQEAYIRTVTQDTPLHGTKVTRRATRWEYSDGEITDPIENYMFDIPINGGLFHLAMLGSDLRRALVEIGCPWVMP